jgi:hypothetical protein
LADSVDGSHGRLTQTPFFEKFEVLEGSEFRTKSEGTSLHSPLMRAALIPLLIVLGCAARVRPVEPGPQAKPPLPVAMAEHAQPQPVALSLNVRPPAEVLAKVHSAFASAYEKMSVTDPRPLRESLEGLFRDFGWRLPVPRSVDVQSALLGNCSFSGDGRLLLFSDAESLVFAESASGRPLGYAVSKDAGLSSAILAADASIVVNLEKAVLVVRETPLLGVRARIAAREDAPFAFVDAARLVTVRPGKGATADDEIVVLEARSGRVVQQLPLTVPVPDAGLSRKIAGLPRGSDCRNEEACNKQELEPEPVGRRVEELKAVGDVVAAGWSGGSTTLHRISDGRLIGAYRPRGETWKPGLVTLQAKPAKAAMATSLKVLGNLGPPLSVTALVDLETGRVTSLLDECRWVTDIAFSESGEQLLVGDLRRACIHDARSGKFMAKTAFVREAWDVDDDLQDTVLSRLGASRWFLTTGDGSWAVVEAANGKLVTKGFGSDSAIIDGDRLYATNTGKNTEEVVILGPSEVKRRPLSAQERQRSVIPPEAADSPAAKRLRALELVLRSTCSLWGFRVPAELCAPPANP